MVKKTKQHVILAIKRSAVVRWFAARKIWQRWVIGGGALVVIVAAVIGVAMYFSWHHNAERIIMESVYKSATASSIGLDGSLVAASPMNTTKVTLKSLGDATNGQLSAALTMAVPSQATSGMAVQGKAVYAGDELFFKIDDAQKLYETMLENSLLSITETTAANAGKSVDVLKAEVRQQYQDLIRPIMNKLGDKWIAVAPEDITGGMSDVKRGIDCVRQVTQTLSEDTGAAREVQRIYERHRFLSVKQRLADDAETTGYAVTMNGKTFSDFSTALEQISAFKNAAACKHITERSKQAAAQQLTSVAGTNPADSGVIELRIRNDSGLLSALKYAATSEQGTTKTTTTITSSFTFHQPVTHQTPTDTIPLSDLKADFDAVRAKAGQS